MSRLVTGIPVDLPPYSWGCMSRWLYYLLVLAVIAPLINLIWGSQQETAIFVFSAIGLIPLAALIGRATEDLEYHVGPLLAASSMQALVMPPK